jgi:hypothetical protein
MRAKLRAKALDANQPDSTKLDKIKKLLARHSCINRAETRPKERARGVKYYPCPKGGMHEIADGK